MDKFKTSLNEIKWPTQCASCAQPANHSVTAKCSVVKKVGYYVAFVSYTSQVLTLTYPACHKHKVISKILSKLSSRNILNLGLGVLAIFLFASYLINLILFLTKMGSQEFNFLEGTIVFFYLIYPIIYFAIYMLIRSYVPIIIYGFDEGDVEMALKNDEFKAVFIKLNKIDEINLL